MSDINRIPICFAKKIDSDEYVEGLLVQMETREDGERTYGIQLQDCYVDENNNQLSEDSVSLYISVVSEIDISTLSVSFTPIN